MIAPVKTLLKKELVWLGSNRCRHSHTYLEHYTCFLEEKPEKCPFVERVGFLDIETTNLHGDFGYVFSYGIKDRDGGILGRILTPKEIKDFTFDKELMRELCQDLRKFHRVIVYWGVDRRFDIPFIRTRALHHGLDFPKYKDLWAQDAYTVVRGKLRLHSNRLGTACEFFNIPSKSHPMSPAIWQRANAGEQKALDYIWAHNKEDVLSLEKLWIMLEPYTLVSKRSL